MENTSRATTAGALEMRHWTGMEQKEVKDLTLANQRRDRRWSGRLTVLLELVMSQITGKLNINIFPTLECSLYYAFVLLCAGYQDVHIVKYTLN